MRRSKTALVDNSPLSATEPSIALLIARHELAVKAARSQAIAPYGSVTSRKRQVAWMAAEAAFAHSISGLVSSSRAAGLIRLRM